MKREEVISTLEKAGLNISPYRRGPSGSHAFSIAKNQSGDGLKVWVPKDADIDVYPDKRKRQAVVSVFEGARQIKNSVRDYISKKQFWDLVGGNKCWAQWEDLSDEAKEFFEDKMRGVPTNTHVPNSRFVPNEVELIDDGLYGSTKFIVRGVSHARRSRHNFLIGGDEDKHFVSVLRKRVYSVDEAHAELRPKGISKNAVRQGEWFFDPVTKKKERELKKLAKTKLFKYGALEGEGSWPYYNRSSHRAMRLRDGKDTYVYGPVVDVRKGYHAPLLLDGFYRVVRNREVKVNPTVRNYD